MQRHFGSAGRLADAALAVLLVAAVAGCGGTPAADSPDGVIRTALDRLAAKDVDGLRSLACAGQEGLIRDQLGLPGDIGGELLPGLDTEALLDAVQLDTSKLEVGDATVDGDVALVPVEGDLGVTFDAEAMRPLLREVLDATGREMTDEQLDALLAGLEAFGQSVPMDQEVRLVREGDAWKICQETITP